MHSTAAAPPSRRRARRGGAECHTGRWRHVSAFMFLLVQKLHLNYGCPLLTPPLAEACCRSGGARLSQPDTLWPACNISEGSHGPGPRLMAPRGTAKFAVDDKVEVYRGGVQRRLGPCDRCRYIERQGPGRVQQIRRRGRRRDPREGAAAPPAACAVISRELQCAPWPSSRGPSARLLVARRGGGATSPQRNAHSVR